MYDLCHLGNSFLNNTCLLDITHSVSASCLIQLALNRNEILHPLMRGIGQDTGRNQRSLESPKRLNFDEDEQEEAARLPKRPAAQVALGAFFTKWNLVRIARYVLGEEAWASAGLKIARLDGMSGGRVAGQRGALASR